MLGNRVMEYGPVVAIFNANDDIVELLRVVLEQSGFVAISSHVDAIKRGAVDILTLAEQHKPSAVIYDVAPPYERQWAFLNHLRKTAPLANLPFVITSTNAAKLRQLVGTDEQILEIVGKPYDLEAIVDAVKKACGGR